VALEALLTVGRGAARQRRRPHGEGVERTTRGRGDATDEGFGPQRNRIGRRGTVDHCSEPCELGVGDCLHRDRQVRNIEPGLVQELPRFVNLGRRRDADRPTHPRLRRDACRVFLPGQRRCGDDALRDGKRVPLPHGADREADAQEQVEKEATVDENGSDPGAQILE